MSHDLIPCYVCGKDSNYNRCQLCDRRVCKHCSVMMWGIDAYYDREMPLCSACRPVYDEYYPRLSELSSQAQILIDEAKRKAKP